MGAEPHDDLADPQQSKRLITASQRLVTDARAQINAATRGLVDAREHLDRSRNVLQAAWLQRELRRRSSPANPPTNPYQIDRPRKAGIVAWGMRRMLTFVDDWGGLLGAVLPLVALLATVALVLVVAGVVRLLL